MTDLVSLLFIAIIPINYKINYKFFLYLFVYFFGNNYNIGELTVPLQKKQLSQILFSRVH